MSNSLSIHSLLNINSNIKDYFYILFLSVTGLDFPCKSYTGNLFNSVTEYTAR